MGRKKSEKTRYFDEEVENSIIEYNQMSKTYERDILFQKKIYPALAKLVENVIHTWKLNRYDTTYEDMQLDTVSFLIEKIHLYTKERGKAYSFFTIIARNYLIQRNMKLYKIENEYLDLDILDTNRDINLEISRNNYVNLLKDFFPYWMQEMDKEIENIFDTKRDQAIAYAIVELFGDVNYIDDFNKKKLYILIREQTGIKTQYITPVLKVMKKYYYKHFKEYQKRDFTVE